MSIGGNAGRGLAALKRICWPSVPASTAQWYKNAASKTRSPPGMAAMNNGACPAAK